jgi:hydroxycarboxylate dehydrogenase B
MSAAATPAPSVLVPQSALRRFARDLLMLRGGASAAHADIVVDHLLEADAMGLRSHGFMRVPQYLAEIKTGEINPRAAPRIAPSSPGRASVDGERGFGQVVGRAMAEEAARLAAETGISFVTGRHMGHTGRIGAYAEAIARRNAVGIVVCSAPRSGHWVAPFGGLEGRIGTNPLAFACPSGGGSLIVADFSTSVAPEGVIRSLKHSGLRAPPGALRDAHGVPTDDPEALYATPRGAIQPIGGPVGYRGTALALLVDVLGALLANDDTDDEDRLGSNLAMIAIATDGAFAERARRMSDYIRSCAPIDPANPVMLPGEREHQAAARLGAGPISVDGPTWRAMIATANADIEVPKPFSG